LRKPAEVISLPPPVNTLKRRVDSEDDMILDEKRNIKIARVKEHDNETFMMEE